MNKFHRILRGLIILLGVLAVGLISLRTYLEKTRARVTTDFGTLGAFQMKNQLGETVTGESLKGKTWVASFIFTRCQGPCPLISYRASELQKEFLSDSFRLVSFSVDPEYDQPDKLMAYSKTYNADSKRWIFLTGEKKATFDLIRKSFHLAVEDDGTGESADQIMHSTFFILVDPQGHIRGYFNSTDAAALADLKRELHQRLGS